MGIVQIGDGLTERTDAGRGAVLATLNREGDAVGALEAALDI